MNGCDDPNCPACTLKRMFAGFGKVAPLGAPEPTRLQTFVGLSEEIEGALRSSESLILRKEAALEALEKMRSSEAECAPLDAIVSQMARHEIAFLRERVTRFRAMLAEAIGQRVIETAVPR